MLKVTKVTAHPLFLPNSPQKKNSPYENLVLKTIRITNWWTTAPVSSPEMLVTSNHHLSSAKVTWLMGLPDPLLGVGCRFSITLTQRRTSHPLRSLLKKTSTCWGRQRSVPLPGPADLPFPGGDGVEPCGWLPPRLLLPVSPVALLTSWPVSFLVSLLTCVPCVWSPLFPSVNARPFLTSLPGPFPSLDISYVHLGIEITSHALFLWYVSFVLSKCIYGERFSVFWNLTLEDHPSGVTWSSFRVLLH